MPPRLTSDFIVSALIRRVQAEGGFAAVVRRGDGTAGAIAIECLDRNVPTVLLEKGSDGDGRAVWRRAAAVTQHDYDQRLDRLIRSDPDLWIVELNVAHAERFTDEILTDD